MINIIFNHENICLCSRWPWFEKQWCKKTTTFLSKVAEMGKRQATNDLLVNSANVVTDIYSNINTQDIHCKHPGENLFQKKGSFWTWLDWCELELRVIESFHAIMCGWCVAAQILEPEHQLIIRPLTMDFLSPWKMFLDARVLKFIFFCIMFMLCIDAR